MRQSHRGQFKQKRTLVFLVRFRTCPDLIILSNSKLPFCVTGEKVSNVRLPVRVDFAVNGGIAKVFGGWGVSPALEILRGLDGEATSAIAGSDRGLISGRQS